MLRGKGILYETYKGSRAYIKDFSVQGSYFFLDVIYNIISIEKSHVA